MLAYLRRFGFFLLTNIAVMVLFGAILSGISYFYPGLLDLYGGMGRLLIYAGLFGFGGAFVSLWASRWMAKKAYSITILDPQAFPSDENLRLVYATVERIAISQNITTPEVGYYESAEPNAFATGASKNSSLVAVSTGLLNTMNKKEIEGVIGHEMAHIMNGDMVTMTLIQGVMNTFVILLSHIAARIVASFLEKDRENALSYFTYQAIYTVFQLVFGFLAMFVVMWFSRTREYRADLGGARFTSKASMLAGLEKLKKIAALGIPSEKRTNLTAFMITEPDSIFSTHPSLDNRIRALEEDYQLA